jgi:UDP:flavonoid glycosyltransferase YjiC (YdhE family)
MTPHKMARLLAEQCNFPLEIYWNTRPILFDLNFSCVQEWVLHAKEFELQRLGRLPDGVVYVGPCIDFERAWSGQEVALPPDKTVILCVLSTVSHGKVTARAQNRLIQTLIQVARLRTDLFFVLGGCDASAELDAGLIPANVLCMSWVPTLSILSRVQLVITQGGANMVKEAIAYCVPVLAFPLRADQPGMAARILYHQVGLMGRMARIRRGTLCAMIDRSLRSESMHSHCEKMQKAFEAYDSADILLRAVSAIVGRGEKG